jgi:hypothetical protein
LIESGTHEQAGGLLAAATETGLLTQLERALPTAPAPARPPLAGSSTAVRRRLLLTMLFLGAVGLHRTWDLRETVGASVEAFPVQGHGRPRDTLSDELGNLLFVASLPIQFPDPPMKADLLAMTSTTLLRDFFRYCRPLNRTHLASAGLRRLFECTLLLAKKLLQGFGKVLVE